MLASQDMLVAVSFVANRRWLIAVVQTIAVHMKHQTTRQLSSLLSHLTSRIHIPLTVLLVTTVEVDLIHRIHHHPSPHYRWAR